MLEQLARSKNDGIGSGSGDGSRSGSLLDRTPPSFDVDLLPAVGACRRARFAFHLESGARSSRMRDDPAVCRTGHPCRLFSWRYRRNARLRQEHTGFRSSATRMTCSVYPVCAAGEPAAGYRGRRRHQHGWRSCAPMAFSPTGEVDAAHAHEASRIRAARPEFEWIRIWEMCGYIEFTSLLGRLEWSSGMACSVRTPALWYPSPQRFGRTSDLSATYTTGSRIPVMSQSRTAGRTAAIRHLSRRRGC